MADTVAEVEKMKVVSRETGGTKGLSSRAGRSELVAVLQRKQTQARALRWTELAGRVAGPGYEFRVDSFGPPVGGVRFST